MFPEWLLIYSSPGGEREISDLEFLCVKGDLARARYCVGPFLILGFSVGGDPGHL